MKQHYFIGIKVPKQIAELIVRERLNTNVHETHKILPVVEDLHITLYYLGHVEKNMLASLIQSLQQIEWESFELTTNGLAHFGNEETPRVVYTALEESDALVDLQHNIVRVLSKEMEINNSKAFNAHITIAKKWAAKNTLNKTDFQLPNMRFPVAHFSIFQINNERIPRYEEIKTILPRLSE